MSYCVMVTAMKTVMNRYLTTTLIILGLIFQPFGMVVSAKRMDGHSDSIEMTMMVSEPSDQSTMAAADSKSQLPCHNENQEQFDNEVDDQCTECCDIGCVMMTQCGAFSTPLASNEQDRVEFPLHKNTFLSSHLASRIGAIPTFIFHPPRHS